MDKSKLNFKYNIGDAVLLSDGRRAIITNYGIYDDQYWCEVSGADGINLAAADYFSTTSTPFISKQLSTDQAQLLAAQLHAATLEFDKQFGSHTTSYRYGPISAHYPQANGE